MIDFDIKNKNQVYRLIAGISSFTALLLACLIIMAPFFPAIILAIILTLATWPAFMLLSRKLKHRTTLAAALMTCLLACFFIFPLVIIGTSITDNFTLVYGTVQQSLRGSTEDTAKILHNIPYAGDYMEKAWRFVAADKDRLSQILQEYAAPTSEKLITLGGTIGTGLMDLTLGVLLSYFFFRHGHRAAVRLSNLIEKFGSAGWQRLLKISKSTLIGVVYGILGTAVAQAALAAFGFWFAGVPGAPFLGLMTFFLSLIPMGPPLLWIPAALWLYVQGKTTLAVFLLFWGALAIGSVDNILKPYFISLGSDLPLTLVLLGVLGGMLSFGFIGVFIGPTILAVAYSLMIEWSSVSKK